MIRIRRRREVACRQMVEMVTDYLEGDLDPTGRAAVLQHLARCPHCPGYVQQVRRMLDLLAELGRDDRVPAELVDELTVRFRPRS